MRQIFVDKGSITLQKVSQPMLDKYTVLVAVHYSSISSGTERSIIEQSAQSPLVHNVVDKLKKVLSSFAEQGFEGTKALIKKRLVSIQPLGYSCSGQVIAIGSNIRSVRVGDYVACAGASIANHADLVVVPEHLIAVVNNPDYLLPASMTTLGAIALQGVRRAQLQLGEFVAVIGLGLLGQLTVQFAKRAGCRVIGIDIDADRLALARNLGADYVFHAQEAMTATEIEFITNHYGVDVSIITAATKKDDVIQQAFQLTRSKGKIVIVGDIGLNFERSPWYEKEIDVLMSCSYGPGRYDPSYEMLGKDYPYPYVRWTEQRNMQAFISMLERKEIQVDPLFKGIYDIEQAEQAYEHINQGSGLSAILRYQPQVTISNMSSQEPKEYVAQNPIIFKPARKDLLRVGMVGAGGFAQVKLMPIISRLKQVTISAVVDTQVTNSMTLSRVYGARKALVSDHELFEQDLVDVVVIASPHTYHAEQSLRALKEGKAVFVEKPMATNFEQLKRLYAFLQHYPHVPFCVDYNRAFAPFIQKIKSTISSRRSPLIIQYRMNAGFVPKDHWIQQEVGAGRIIGEACHIFDLFCFLTEAKPIAVSVETITGSQDDLFPTDNFNAQISFSDGSVCSLLYTSLGHAQLGKERMEIFFDSKSIVMDDYTTLKGFGLPASFNETLSRADKGHEHLINQFFDALKGKTTVSRPVPLDRLYNVAYMTLVIDQLACAGGGQMDL